MTHASNVSNHKLIQSSYGISRYSMMEYLTKFKRIPTAIIEQSNGAIPLYKLLKWSTSHLINSLKETENTGILTRFDKQFIVIYASNCSRGKILASILTESQEADGCKEKDWWISFREAAPIYNLPAYCIISSNHSEELI